MSYHLQRQQPATTRDASQQLSGYITPSGGYLGAVNAASIFSSSWFPFVALGGVALLVGLALRPPLDRAAAASSERARKARRRAKKVAKAAVTVTTAMLLMGGAGAAGYLYGKGII